MKLHLQRDSLMSAVAWAARTLPGRPTQPILAGLRLATTEGFVSLSSFDREVSSVAELATDAVAEQVVILPGRLLADIVKALPHEDVLLEWEGTRATIRSGKVSFSLPTLPAEEYPPLPADPQPIGVIPGADLARCVTQVAIASGKDESLVMLTGIRVEIDGPTMTMAATDRYRLAVQEVSWRCDDDTRQTNLLIPARTLVDVSRSMGQAGDVTIGLAGDTGAERLIGFSAQGRRSTSRLLDAEFPKYRSLLPTESTTEATMATAAVLEAVRRVSIVADRTTPVRCSFAGGELSMRAGTGDDATAEESVEISLAGDPIEIAFNPGFLIDGLAALGTAEVAMAFTEPRKPMVMTSEQAGAYRYLLMPIRLTG